MVALKNVKDSKGVPLYMDSMIKEWGLQRLHIRHGCLSDSLVDGGVLYRFTGYIHLGHVESPETKLATWQSLRGSSQLEGLLPHQAKWVTGTHVSCGLFQAQGFFGVVKWNWKRAEEHMNLELPKMFDRLLTAKINSVSLEENEIKKYPDLTVNEADTGENFGLDYISSDPIRTQENDVPVTSTTDCNPEEEHSVDLTLQTELENLISTNSAVVTSSSLHLTEAQPKIPEVPQSQSSHCTSPAGKILTEYAVSQASDNSIGHSSSTTPSRPSQPHQHLKRKLTTVDSLSPSKQVSLESKLKQVQTSHRIAFGGVVTPWAPEYWTTEMKTKINDLLCTTKLPTDIKKLHRHITHLYPVSKSPHPIS